MLWVLIRSAPHEVSLMRTHNIRFGEEIRKIFTGNHIYLDLCTTYVFLEKSEKICSGYSYLSRTVLGFVFGVHLREYEE